MFCLGCLFQDTGKQAYLKDLPNSLCKFETFMAKTNSGFLVGKEVSSFYNAWFFCGIIIIFIYFFTVEMQSMFCATKILI